jgi:hypothetical protein
MTAEERLLLTDEGQASAIKELKGEVSVLKERTGWVLLPIAAVLAILGIGGAFSVVFSIRDQRRVSQLHELSVAGEISSQRRTEQSYGAFLEQSQTTIALVNDTLRLAKDASDREVQSGRSKAKERVSSIENRAENMMLPIFSKEDFELIIEDAETRRELIQIGRELRELDASLSLQEVELRPYAKFVKAMALFVGNETEAAIDALRKASQIS